MGRRPEDDDRHLCAALSSMPGSISTSFLRGRLAGPAEIEYDIYRVV